MFIEALVVAIGAGFAGAILLILRSLSTFTQTGPKVREEILKHYKWFSVLSLTRLAAWVFLLLSWMAVLGQLPYLAWCIIMQAEPSLSGLLATGLASIALITILQFSQHLLYIPSSIMVSSNYMMSRFYTYWKLLTPSRLRLFRITIIMTITVPVLWAMIVSGFRREWMQFFYILIVAVMMFLPYVISCYPKQHRVSAKVGREGNKKNPDKPNVLMIGSDTFRVDRLGIAGYKRNLTPFIDELARKGTAFLNCYTPIARTAPSLATLLTGLWPTTHGIRDNFNSDDESKFDDKGLASILGDNGYQTAAISDWAGSDLGKFPFGFDHIDTAPDQWNLKYLIRQGPKDLRLFLSLFTHNLFGKYFLPEIYYLAGVPLTSHIGAVGRKWISRFRKTEEPFFLNIFTSTTHPPFGCEYPYYTKFSSRSYSGESKFAMSRLVDPDDIIRSMKEPREEFELDQVIDLYDSCISRFDDEVKSIIGHLRQCGLEDNTIIVLYSDHAIELFEHNTWGQGNNAVSETSPKIPLVILDPRSDGHGVDNRVVRTVDLFPTILDCCGIDLNQTVDGCSLVPYMNNIDLDWKLPAYYETAIWLARPPGQHDDHLRYPEIQDLLCVPNSDTGTLAIKEEYKDSIIKARDRMVRVGKWKVVRRPMVDGQDVLLFDLESDPDCRTDLASENPDVVSELLAILDQWLCADNIR